MSEDSCCVDVRPAIQTIGQTLGGHNKLLPLQELKMYADEGHRLLNLKNYEGVKALPLWDKIGVTHQKPEQVSLVTYNVKIYLHTCRLFIFTACTG